MEQNTRFALLSRAEHFSYLLECGINVVNAIHTAMSEGPFSGEEFANGLFFVWWYLNECQKGLQDTIEKLYKEDNK